MPGPSFIAGKRFIPVIHSFNFLTDEKEDDELENCTLLINIIYTTRIYTPLTFWRYRSTITLSEAWSGVNWADLMAAQGAFGTDFYVRSTLRPKHRSDRPVIKIGPKGALGSHEIRPIHSAPSLGQSIDVFFSGCSGTRVYLFCGPSWLNYDLPQDRKPNRYSFWLGRVHELNLKILKRLGLM